MKRTNSLHIVFNDTNEHAANEEEDELQDEMVKSVPSPESNTKKKRRRKKKKNKNKLPEDQIEFIQKQDDGNESKDGFNQIHEENASQDAIPFGEENSKYWAQRFQFFSKFDEGMQLDKEGWYSVTPELLAQHQASRCAGGIIVDAFCGVGGNTIQFAQTCDKVIAIDVNPSKVTMAKHNAKVYGVADKIEFIVGDFLQLYKTIKADVVFLAPPWGGPSYADVESWDLNSIGGVELFQKTQTITNNIAYLLPKNTQLHQLVHLAGKNQRCEIEKNYINGQLKTITAYYGDLIQEDS